MNRTVGLLVAGSLVAAAGCSEGRVSSQRVKSSPVPTASPAASAAPDPVVKAASVRLERFDTCRSLLEHIRGQAAKVVGPWGMGAGIVADGAMRGRPQPARAAAAQEDSAATAQGASAGAGADYSATNVQEAGVDEPDLVKTDGKRILAMARGKLYAISVDGAKPSVAGSLEIGPGWSNEMLLAGDRALVFAGGVDAVPMRGGAAVSDADAPVTAGGSRTTITVVEVSNPAAMRVVSKLSVDGDYVSARTIGGVARVVVRSWVGRLGFTPPAGPSEQAQRAALARNRALVDKSRIEDWLPRFSLEQGDKRSEGNLASCSSTYRPVGFEGLGMASVLTIDPADPSPKPSASVLADSQVIYASPKSLYIATNAFPLQPAVRGGDIVAAPSIAKTEIHLFDISSKDAARYVASGAVPGRILNQWSLSEYRGFLRVATTEGEFRPDVASQSSVTVLSVRDQALVPVGKVGDLGKGERIYAVRFMDDRGYVVTFRQTDPLYVLNLADPAKPRVTGELKIPGYSAYLHPLSDGFLLGVGQDASEEGRVQGTQASIFDVRDPANPKRVQNWKLDQAHSEVESDHHAFLYWGPKRMAVLPLQRFAPDGQFSGAVALHVDPSDAITEIGRIAHPYAQQSPPPGRGEPEYARAQLPIRRALVIGDRLYTVSESGVLASDMGSLKDAGWAAFS